MMVSMTNNHLNGTDVGRCMTQKYRLDIFCHLVKIMTALLSKV